MQIKLVILHTFKLIVTYISHRYDCRTVRYIKLITD